MRPIAAAIATLLLVSCAPAVAPTLVVRSDSEELPADGLTPATVEVSLDPPMDGVAAKLSVNLGALAQTSVALRGGKATVTMWPPFEQDLGALSELEVRVAAEVLLEEGQLPLRAATEVHVTAPAVGAPTLILSADPQRVRADGATPIVVRVVGRRLSPGTEVVLTASSDVAIPASVVLGDDATAEIVLAGRTDPVSFELTASAAGASPFTIPLGFLTDDAPSYDVTGTFAQIAYGVVEISGTGINPSPQVVSAPTISKVTIIQDETGFEVTYETCAVQMPVVCIGVFGDPEPSTTTPGPGFVDAIPDSTMRIPFRGREMGAVFEPDATTLEQPLIVGAALTNPTEPLPESADDPRITDDDQDGNPGVTVTNSSLGSQQFIVYRTRTTTMRGVVESNDAIDGSDPGSLVAETETKILNGDFLTSTFAPRVSGRPSTFRMVRVDGRTGGIDIAGNDGVPADISCADVRLYLSDPSGVLPPPPSTSSCGG